MYRTFMDEISQRQRVQDALNGAVVTTVTPFAGDGDLDEPAVRRIVGYLLDAGVRTLIPCGNTGEFHSLTVDEWRRVVSSTVEESQGRAVVIAAVGGSIGDALEATRYARECNADGVMILPVHHTYSTPEGIRSYYERILDIGVPAIGYLRSRTTFVDIAPLVEHPMLAGAKWAVTDVAEFANARAATAGADFTWSCGLAEQWAPMFWTAGARGFTSGLGNFAPGVAIGLYRALADGDWETAMTIRDGTADFERFRARHDSGYNVVAVKEAMRMVGLDAGAVRPPLSPVAEGERPAMQSAVQSVLQVDRDLYASRV